MAGAASKRVSSSAAAARQVVVGGDDGRSLGGVLVAGDDDRFLGTARIVDLRGGIRAVKKTVHVPVSMAQEILGLARTHRRASDGLVTYRFSDVLVDLVAEALEHRRVVAAAAQEAAKKAEVGRSKRRSGKGP